MAPGRRLAILTNNDEGALTALVARQAGMELAVLADTRPRNSAPLSVVAESRGVPCLFEAECTGTGGRSGLRWISVLASGQDRRIACDALAVTAGTIPARQLAAQAELRVAFQADTEPAFATAPMIASDGTVPWLVAGSVTGAVGLQAALAQGHAAPTHLGITPGPAIEGPVASMDLAVGGLTGPWRARRARDSRVWVDIQNDVKLSDLHLAVRENYVHPEHLKRYTTLGMGTDQGRTATANGMAVLADLTGREPAAVGATRLRPPAIAMRMGTIAHLRQGDCHEPRRQLPAAAVHHRAGAIMEDFGWQRPDWYGGNGADRDAAVAAEKQAVRQCVGVFDASPLGKIEVAGLDARSFLDRLYAVDLTRLRRGRIRYGLMLNENGTILDDGVVACLDETLFLAGPSSANAGHVARWLQRWHQTEWPELRVSISDVTVQWATLALAGPQARALLSMLEPEFPMTDSELPHMSVAEGRVAGLPARIARVSFTGEVQFEVSVPARDAAPLLGRMLDHALAMGGRPVGLEAWLQLWIEKGYIHLGTETNGRTTPDDLGFGALIARKQAGFIDKRALALPGAGGARREQLVGLRAVSGRLRAGGASCATARQGRPARLSVR